MRFFWYLLRLLKLLWTFIGAAFWWLLDKIWGDQIWDWIRPMIPDFADPLLKHEIITWVPPSIMLALGIYLTRDNWWRQHKEPSSLPSKAQEVPVTPHIDAATCCNRDIDLYDALWRAFLGRWGNTKFDLEAPSVGQEVAQVFHDLVTDDFRQKVSDGIIPVWGRNKKTRLWDSIPTDYWKTHEPDWFTFLEGKEHFALVSRDINREEGEWESPMTNRRCVDEAFPVRLCLPSPDRSLAQAIRYVVSRVWPTANDHSVGGRIVETNSVAAEIWKAAIENKLTLWGKRDSDPKYVPVPHDYLASNPFVATIHAHAVRPDRVIAKALGDRRPDLEYEDLMVNSSEVEATWPRKK